MWLSPSPKQRFLNWTSNQASQYSHIHFSLLLTVEATGCLRPDTVTFLLWETATWNSKPNKPILPVLLLVKAFYRSYRNKTRTIVQTFVGTPLYLYRKDLFHTAVQNEFSRNLVTHGLVRNEMKLNFLARLSHCFRKPQHQAKPDWVFGSLLSQSYPPSLSLALSAVQMPHANASPAWLHYDIYWSLFYYELLSFYYCFII